MLRPMKTLASMLIATAVAAYAAVAAGHDGKLSFAPVLERVTPAVVNIQVSGEQAVRHPLFNDPNFRRFFRGLPERRNIGAGSGVIIDADKGHVVTNHHVIDGADEITVKLNDRREFAAELVGSDPDTDIALLKIAADDLSEVLIGDSETLAVGDFVIAIGNPFDLGQTVTSGIVSALGRGGFNRDGYEDFIQTDAAINRGNSGGALVDLEGRLVGINSVIVSPSGVNAGVGFAVPTRIVAAVTDQLLEFGGVRRGYLGVQIRDVQPEHAEVLGLATADGAIVTQVMADSAAQAAGVEPGDVIVRVNDEEIVDGRSLRAQVGLTPVGEKVELGLVRNGKRIELDATIGQLQSASVAAEESTPILAGAELRDLSPDDASRGRSGVEVASVDEDSRAQRAGLRAGDIIVRVNRRPVATVQEFQAAVADARALALHIQRGDTRLFAIVR